MFSHLQLDDFSAFKRLEWLRHGSINVVVGVNDTGKTHLLKIMYCLVRALEEFNRRSQSDKPPWSEVLADKLYWAFQPGGEKLGDLVRRGAGPLKANARIGEENLYFSFGKDTRRKIVHCSNPVPGSTQVNGVFLPPKEVLTAFEAIASTRENLQIFGFDDTYLDLIKALRLPTTKGKIQKNLKSVLDKLSDLFAGDINRHNDHFVFNSPKGRFWMSQTAEGVKKIGILTTLIRNRTLGQGSILFLDEPEAHLHPRAIVSLMGMLYEMSKAGIQIYLATHDYFVVKSLSIIAGRKRMSIPFCSLERREDGVTAEFSDLKDGMPENRIVDEAVRLYEADLLSAAE